MMENAIEFLESINRVAPIGIGIVVDRVFRMTNWYLTELTGYSQEELIGRNARMLYETQAEYERVGKIKYDQIRRAGTGIIETRFQCKDGGLVDVLLASTPLDINDFSKGVTFTATNITDLVLLKTGEGYVKELRAIIDSYRQAMAILKPSAEGPFSDGQILSVAAALKQVEENSDVEFIMSDLADIFEEYPEGTGRIRKIVADLKDFAHPEAPERQLVDLHQCLDSTINIVWNELKYKAEVIKAYGDLPPVNCYPQQINQVFVNLLVNAAHAIEKKGIIRIQTQAGDENVEVHISDTGCGIPKQHQTKIFDPFFTTKPVGKGTGLGLSMSYGIIQRHKGRILVESEVGKGTCFKVILPISESA